MEKFRFVGRKYSANEKEELSESLSRRTEQELIPFEGESEKTPEEIKIIAAAEQIVQNFMAGLGSEAPVVDTRSIHIVPHEVYVQMNGDSGRGISYPALSSMNINRDAHIDAGEVFMTVLHEMLHHHSIHALYASEEGDESLTTQVRSGYDISRPYKQKGHNEKLFNGFNEVLIEASTYQLTKQNLERLTELGIMSAIDFQHMSLEYLQHWMLVKHIAQTVATNESDPENPHTFADVWAQWQKGLFQEHLLTLKPIERSFGKHSIRILSLLDSQENEQDRGRVNAAVARYFTSGSEEEREEIRKDLEPLLSWK
jgi:hypothetical protein